MGEERTRIIVEEIEKWKESRLLPEMYCEYLLALYTQGESEGKKEIKRNNFFQSILPLIVQICLLIVSLFVLYSQLFTISFQIITLFFMLIIAIFIHYKCKINNSSYFIFITFITLIVFLLMTAFVGQAMMDTNQVSFIFLGNFILWFIMGRRYESTFLLIMSILATIFTIVYIFL